MPKIDEYGYRYLGNYSATEPWHNRHMTCYDVWICWRAIMQARPALAQAKGGA